MSHRCRAFACTLMVALAFPAARSHAEEKTFDFKDPKGVNSISFLLDSPLEPIAGLASGISGTIRFDPSAPEKISGTFSVDAKTLHTQNERMTGVLHSEDWLSVEEYPKITFTIKKASQQPEKVGHKIGLTVVGDLSVKGVTKEITIPINVSHLPGKMAQRIRGQEGDLLVLRSNFTIQRKDFGIKPAYGPDVVAESIQLTVAIVGSCPNG